MQSLSLFSTRAGTHTATFKISSPYYPPIQRTLSSLPRVNISLKHKTNISDHCSLTSSPHQFRCLGASSAAGSYDSNEHEISPVIQLPDGLKPELMPKHVGLILDGSRRWAIRKNMPVEVGPLAAATTLKKLILTCMSLGIKVFTVFAFSTENWVRSKEETDYLMTLFTEGLKSETDTMKRYGLQLSVIGDRQGLPESLQYQIAEMELAAKGNTGMHLVGALNYSGRYDITAANRKIAAKVRDGALRVEDIDEDLFEQHLETSVYEYPNPDLLIRTSGECRISNFMLWQLAYSELYFSDKLFPDFDSIDLIEAVRAFQKRHRRYGGHKYTSEA